MLGMCFNPRVLVGLALVGAAVWAIAPGAILAVLPLLVLALCPLSMVAMAWMMRGSMSSNAAQDPVAKLAALEREQERLRLEIAHTRAEGAAAPQPSDALPTVSNPQR
jgi:hypothetical protein